VPELATLGQADFNDFLAQWHRTFTPNPKWQVVDYCMPHNLFNDSVAAYVDLAPHVREVIVSKADRQRLLGVDVTAQAGSYSMRAFGYRQ